MFRLTLDARNLWRAGVFRLCALLTVVLALTGAGCAPGAISADEAPLQMTQIQAAPAQTAPVQTAYVKPTSYRISEGDRLDVKVFGEPEMSGEVQVDGEGTISLPLVGRLKAAGLTAGALRGQITRQIRAKGYVQDPNVTVSILSYEPFNIFGEVRNAGQYNYRPGMTVQDAIALAGGYTYRANKKYIHIKHENGSREEKLSMAGEKLYVQPGDSLRVSERFF